MSDAAIMIVTAVVFVAIGGAVLWYLLARGPESATLTRADFDAAWDRLVAEGQALEGERETAWRDFHSWQVADEHERRAWEEPAGE